MIDITILGNSQCVAMKNAIDDMNRRGEQQDPFSIKVRPIGSGAELLEDFFEQDSDRVITKSKYYHSVEFSASDNGAYIGVCAPLYSLSISTNRGWREFSYSGDLRKKRPVSNALLRVSVLESQRYMLNYIEALRNIDLNVFVIEGPRPFRHHKATEYLSPEIVIELDRRYREIICDHLREIKIPIVEVPGHCIDDIGFTKSQYRLEKEGDQNHGNVDFGRIMIDEVKRFLQF